MLATRREGSFPAWRRSALVMLLGLLLQFLLGMAVNLFVEVPRHHPGANPPEYFSGVAESVTWAILQGPRPWLMLHAALGILLVLGSFVVLGQAISDGRRGAIAGAGLGALGVLGAGFNGGSFLNYGEDFSSMLMATGFALGILGFVTLLALSPVRALAESTVSPSEP
ncbi:MAG TPA: hypothetical protein VKY90_11890 [Candidatus Dormibacteraeota bacterium]|nr:hypothetical protein [Candidatus Dormibacteraeota bacterium]